MTTTAPACALTTNSFLDLLPTIRSHAQRAFRKHHAERRHEFVQEVIASAFVAFARLLERGRCHLVFPAVLARFGIRRVYSGRRVGTPTNQNDVMSPAAHRFWGLTVKQSDPPNELGGWHEAIVEDTQTPVLDQVCFRVDFPEWLSRLTKRDRQIAEALGGGTTTGEVARAFQLSAARISQLRRALHESWLEYQGEPLPEELFASRSRSISRPMSSRGDRVEDLRRCTNQVVGV